MTKDLYGTIALVIDRSLRLTKLCPLSYGVGVKEGVRVGVGTSGVKLNFISTLCYVTIHLSLMPHRANGISCGGSTLKFEGPGNNSQYRPHDRTRCNMDFT